MNLFMKATFAQIHTKALKASKVNLYHLKHPD